MNNDILSTVNAYYTEKVKEHGNTPRGVDWNSAESQQLRFDQLCKVMNDGPCSLLDLGCGYGALLNYLVSAGKDVEYTGFDISEEMITRAKASHNDKKAQWTTSLDDNMLFDHSVASGIFNVRLQVSESDWVQYVLDTLDLMDKHSRKGFSFNMLTSYSDKEYMREHLYYADPSFFFDVCKKRYSKYVALLHDYPLYEFTILVKK